MPQMGSIFWLFIYFGFLGFYVLVFINLFYLKFSLKRFTGLGNLKLMQFLLMF